MVNIVTTNGQTEADGLRAAEAEILDGPVPPELTVAELAELGQDVALEQGRIRLTTCRQRHPAGQCSEGVPCQPCIERRRVAALKLHRVRHGRPLHPSEVAAQRNGQAHVTEQPTLPSITRQPLSVFMASRPTQEYLIRHALPRAQPCIMAGAQKTLKTTAALDMAVSLSTGSPWLNYYDAPQAVRVGVLSCESGEATIWETLSRIYAARGIDPASESYPSLSFAVPDLASPLWHAALRKWVQTDRLDVLILDPAYLMMPMDSGAAANLFEVGRRLMPLSQLANETGVTPILLHHARQDSARAGKPLELSDIAWAGFAQWARAWILLSRREPYDPDGPGEHRLLLSTGGSAGHSSRVAVDITEARQSDPGGRRWEVRCQRWSEAEAEAHADRERDRQGREQADIQGRAETILAALARHPGGETRNRLRDEVGMSSTRFAPALAALLADERIIETTITRNRRSETAYRCAPGHAQNGRTVRP